ncbi:uncharacterized protein LOC106672643 isoform X1 [Cimex lectularius]|uniref:EB domain-containing protein n=1 Tax=Cimex lectularius TaxID=79782 RepID=A0A8I6SFF6_CIMLE|nr:uncharacterized protein LOC106672643 isoform X1 [Cimex lectularius]
MCSHHISRTTLVFFQLGVALCTASGQNYGSGVNSYAEFFCLSPQDCQNYLGAICYNQRCMCDIHGRIYPPCYIPHYGEECKTDADCNYRELNFICLKEMAGGTKKICMCRRGQIWDIVSKRCYDQDTPYINVGEKFDPTRDVIIPSVILMTLGATAWLCFKLFCNNCGKSWRRRRRGHTVPRAIGDGQLPVVGPSQSTTWVASYRVFGPVNGVDSRAFTRCLLLPAGPPPYEEALKHKVVLSSYQPPPTTPPLDHAQL